MAVFNIPKSDSETELGRSSFEDHTDFVSYLGRNYWTLSNNDLHVIVGITERDETHLLSAFENQGWTTVEDFENIRRLRREENNKGRVAGVYFHYDSETGLFYLYTDQPKVSYIDEIIVEDLEEIYRVSQLYISPWRIRRLASDISDSETGATVSEFVAKRTSNSRVSAQKRGDKRKTFNYYGEDGLETLGDLVDMYGVLPTTLEIRIGEKISFRVDSGGIFKLLDGSINVLFDYIDGMIEGTVNVKEAYDSTEKSSFEIGDDTKVEQSSPARVVLPQNEEYTTSDMDSFVDYLRGSGYIPVDPYVESEPLYFYSKVYDEQNNLYVDVRADKEAIRIYPRDQQDISTFIGIYQGIQQVINPEAEAKEVDTK